jgi:hypothetical protein
MATFPAIRPTEREFIAGGFPVIAPEFQSMVRYARLGGTMPFDQRLNFDFQNIEDANAALIIACYEETLSGFMPVELPDELMSGLRNDDLIRFFKGQGRVKWFFAEKPTVEAVIVGYSSVRVSLRGALR